MIALNCRRYGLSLKTAACCNFFIAILQFDFYYHAKFLKGKTLSFTTCMSCLLLQNTKDFENVGN